MREAVLRVASGKQSGTTIPLAAGKFLVGREEDCHLRPNSDLVSRHHCVFTVDEFAVRLRDLGSTNGTLVNGERIRGGVMLNTGDIVSIGKIEFEVLIRDPSQETATHLSLGSDTQYANRPAAAPVESATSENPPTDNALIGDEIAGNATLADLSEIVGPGVTPPAGDTQFLLPTQPSPQPPVGYPQMGYPPMQMMPPYGYGGYPQMPQMPMYGQHGMYPGMGYGMPGMYPPGMPQMGGYPGMAPVEAPSEAQAEAPPTVNEIPVKLPDPEQTGAKAPEAPKPAPGGQQQTAEAKAKAEAPLRAADIIAQYRGRRPQSDGKK